jgi:hypothetical protein
MSLGKIFLGDFLKTNPHITSTFGAKTLQKNGLKLNHAVHKLMPKPE